MTNLILVEGLPGAGKSTTAQLIKELLEKRYDKVYLFQEGDLNHPADYEGVAFLTPSQFESLGDQFPTDLDLIKALALRKDNGYFISYAKAKSPGQWIEAVKPFDIYELSFEEHQALVIEKWRSFVKGACNQDDIVIFECCLMQNPITMSFIKEGQSEETTMNYIHQLAQMMKPLQPVVIYVNQDSIEKMFQHAMNERPDEWRNFFINYYTSQGYGAKNGLTGIEGVIEILKKRRVLEQALLQSLEFPVKVVNNETLNLDTLNQQLMQCLKELNF